MDEWQEAASQQFTVLTNQLHGVLTKGLGLLRSELGVDLGLKPELIPPWVILLAACTGLILMLVLWASACRALFNKQPAVNDDDQGGKQGRERLVKAEEPKKKKKKAEKKAQPNGRAVEPQEEEAPVSEEILPHQQTRPPLEVKAEKASEVKKSKKKGKQAVKDTKTVAGKEPEEGTWETKVSNKEKREQRKKDKGSSDGSASPGGGDTPVNTPEQPKASPASPAAAPASQKKRKGESTKVKAEKVDVVVPKVISSEVAAVVAAPVVTEMAVTVPAHTIAPKVDPWTTSRESASLWRSEIDDSWTVIERSVPTEPSVMSFAGLSAGPVEPQSVSEPAWRGQPRPDDQWSGINGGSADPSSDWNAPSEVWGNYEEPTPEPTPTPVQPPAEPAQANLLISAADEDEDEKERGETASDGAAKSKKKKKKKKKAAEEGGVAGQTEEPEKEAPPAASTKKQPSVQENTAAVQPVKAAAAVEARVEQPVKDNISQKPPVTQVPLKPTDGESTAKQNNSSAPTQKKPEESQAAKPAKKKKARRET